MGRARKVLTLNAISARGLARLPQSYIVGGDVVEPDAVLVRSANMHEMEIPSSVRAIGRAGAGTNNIPVKKLSERGVPVIGLVYNMASLTCPHCDREIDLFAQSNRLRDAGVRVLGRIPFDVRLSEAADQGRPLVLGDPRGPVAYEFARIGSAVRGWLRDPGAASASAAWNWRSDSS